MVLTYKDGIAWEDTIKINTQFNIIETYFVDSVCLIYRCKEKVLTYNKVSTSPIIKILNKCPLTKNMKKSLSGLFHYVSYRFICVSKASIFVYDVNVVVFKIFV